MPVGMPADESLPTLIEKTELLGERKYGAAPAPAPTPAAPSRVVPLILAAAAVLAVIAGYWLYQRGRTRTESAELVPRGTESSVPLPTAAAPETGATGSAPPPTAAPIALQPTALPAGVAASNASAPAEPTVPRPPRVRPTRSVEEVASASRAREARFGRHDSPQPASRDPALLRDRKPTSYAQAAVRRSQPVSTPEQRVFRGPRPDAGSRSRWRSRRRPDRGPAVSRRCAAGQRGDTSITLAKIEESAGEGAASRASG
jgi:hypothetical protein